MSAEGKPEAEKTPTGDAAPVLSNFQRLGQHLKPGSLAAKLVDAWESGTHATAHQRLLDAVKAHNAPKDEADGKGAS